MDGATNLWCLAMSPVLLTLCDVIEPERVGFSKQAVGSSSQNKVQNQ